MYDFDALVTEVIRSKPDVGRERLLEMVQEKKRTVGSGYLTDQGALFLIAGELGVRLQHMVSSDLTLKDLHMGANDITVVARVLAIYPVSEFKKKDGSGVGRYRRVNLFDRNGVGRLTIWEDNAEAMALNGVAVDTPVRIVSAYVKPGLDGKPNLNLGKRGRIEIVTEAAIVSKLAPLSTLAKKLEAVQEGESAVAVEGVATSDSRSSTFTRRDDGSTGSLTQFEMSGAGGKTARVVVWDGTALPAVKSGASVRVTNLREKKGRQGETELHGDSATVIQIGVGGNEARIPEVISLVKVAEVSKHAGEGKLSLEVMALSKGVVREVSLRDGSKVKKGEVVLGDDTGEITTVAWDGASKMIEEIKVGEKFRVVGAAVQVSKMGVETLELRDSTKIEKI